LAELLASGEAIVKAQRQAEYEKEQERRALNRQRWQGLKDAVIALFPAELHSAIPIDPDALADKTVDNTQGITIWIDGIVPIRTYWYGANGWTLIEDRKNTGDYFTVGHAVNGVDYDDEVGAKHVLYANFDHGETLHVADLAEALYLAYERAQSDYSQAVLQIYHDAVARHKAERRTYAEKQAREAQIETTRVDLDCTAE
jgi:hypothetical protein